MLDKNNLQVKEGYYSRREYNSLERFISYFYQIDSVLSLSDVYSILEIGPGSKTVTRELTSLGYNVTTSDFDKTVNPDIVSDVRELPFENESFDCIIACQVLEHIPYEDFEKVLDSFGQITKKYIIISLPYRHTGFEFIIKFPFIQSFFKKKFFDFFLSLPIKFPGFKESGQHYWEIDFFTTNKKKIFNSLNKNFSIIKEFNPPLNKYHKFFILKKKFYE